MTLVQSNVQLNLGYAAACFVCAAVGAAYDVTSRRVPNLLTGPAILLALIMHGVLGGWSQLGSAAMAGLFCGGVFLLFHVAGGMGAGDVKLIAATACFGGLGRAAPLLLFTSLAGGVMAITLALYRGRFKQTVFNLGKLVAHHRQAGLQAHPDLNVRNTEALRLPYALAIAAGSAVTMISTIWMVAQR